MTAETLGVRWGLNVANYLGLNNIIMKLEWNQSFRTVVLLCSCGVIAKWLLSIGLKNFVAHELVSLSKLYGSRNWVGIVPNQIFHYVCTDAAAVLSL
jgi:hypothetical protein